MEYYAYNPTTKEFIGKQQGQLDPLETKIQGKDVYLIPANSTTAVVPELKEHQCAVFNGTDWDVVADYRGCTYYINHQPYTMSYNQLGDLPEGATLEDTYTDVELLERAKTKALSNLSSSYIVVTSYSSSKSSLESSLGITVNGDKSSVDNLAMLINSLENDTDTVPYRLFDNTYTDLTKTQLETLKSEISANLLAKTKEYSEYKDKINACTTVAEVESITW